MLNALEVAGMDWISYSHLFVQDTPPPLPPLEGTCFFEYLDDVLEPLCPFLTIRLIFCLNLCLE